MIDLLSAVLLLAGASTLALGYGLRVLREGAARYDRVERDGGSAVLGRSVMAMGYWALQPVGRALVRARVPPGAVTAGGIVLGVIAGVAAATGHLGVAALLMMVAAASDGLDGLVARAMGRCTRSGAALDAAGDRYQEFAFLGGLAVLYRQDLLGLLLALAALLGASLTSYVSAKAEALKVAVPRGLMRRPERAVYLVVGALAATLAGSEVPMYLALALIAAFANGSAAHRLYRLMASLDAEDGVVPWRPRLPVLLRHQTGAAAATALDLALLVALVELLEIPPVVATALGAASGAVLNFELGRRWIFDASSAPAGPQAARYAGVTAAGVGLTTLGEWGALAVSDGHYLAARIVVGAALSLLWYYPLHARYVFRLDARVSGVGPA